tara:strand:- start:1040 stop:2812 length:1773 start_codon:yes stop_codon:yes gene_type:complete
MKYPKEYLDEIKTRLKVSTVVSKSINLKKRGKEFVGLSPFKNEKTPSFTVNDEKGFYHCFSTGEHGNIFDFLIQTQNLKFGEAVKILANLAGMRPYTFSKEDEIREKNYQIYISIYSEYVKFYHEKLILNNSPSIPKGYLKKRELNLEQQKKFKIGYVEENINFFENLKERFHEKNILETGLFFFDEKKKKNVERFKGRIIFPINNISGKTIGLGGRTIKESKYLAKYINSPETQFFKKGSNLYNLDFVRKLSNKVESVFLVEGYMDVVGLSKYGIENAVANLGTALTDKQILLLNQFFEHIIICFDSDESGYRAAIKAAENSIKELQPKKKISFLFLPNGEDPDSFIKKKGKDYFNKYSKENLIPIHKFIFKHYESQTENNPTSLAVFEKTLRSIVGNIKDQYIKKYILEYFLEKISNFTPNIKKKSRYYEKKLRPLESTKKHLNETQSLSQIELKEFSFLYLIINNLHFFCDNFKIIESVKIFTKENQIVFQQILKKLNSQEKISLEYLEIDKQIINRIFKFAPIKHILNDKYKDLNKIMELTEEIIRDLKNYELELRIQDLESKFSKDFSESTYNEIRELKKLKKIN